ncbi:Glycerophosphoryl diester phosphodiesterase family-domain-containing protein [Stachybotrys elegans]|uniref:Glycerophosphoryl diester phosphodiesterase family-domain-containing protein n=1 Tax=Stachybotrys elegans TaxID=80388 RepID=A0A8K0WWA6_9HYPO|nr:Glycerophosphoryl diester phosphodiesterase family-domain-containing protein [Stachybotrys elegans]
MRFSRNIREPKVPAWADSYVDYLRLKRLVNRGQSQELDAAFEQEHDLFIRFAEALAASVHTHVAALETDWALSLGSHEADLPDFGPVFHCELEHLRLVIKELLGHLSDVFWYLRVNAAALDRIVVKATACDVLLPSQCLGFSTTAEAHQRMCNEYISKVNGYLIRIGAALEQDEPAQCSSLLPCSPDVKSAIPSLVSDDVNGLQDILSTLPAESQASVAGQLLRFAVIHGAIKCQELLLSQPCSTTYLHDVIRQAQTFSSQNSDAGLTILRKSMSLVVNQKHALTVIDSCGRRPLHVAARYLQDEHCLQLVYTPQTASTDAHAVDYSDPLDMAIVHDNVAAVKVLLDAAKEADIVTSKRSSRYLALAILAKRDEIAFLLASEGFGLDFQSRTGNSVLHLAIDVANASVVKVLLDAGVDCNTRDNQGVTPLALASIFGHAEMVGMLVASGANQDTVDCRAWKPKDHAAYRGHLHVVKMLDDQGTPLIEAAPLKRLPRKSLIPLRLPEQSVVFVNLGTLDLSSKTLPIDLHDYHASRAVSWEGNLSLRISLRGDSSQTVEEPLPLLNKLDVPRCFVASAPDKASLSFQLLAEGTKKPVATAIALLSNLRAGLGAMRESLVREYTLPLADAEGALVGTVSFSFVIARPFSGSIPDIEPQKVQSLDATVVGGHRGNGQNNTGSKLQIGENTLQSFRSAIGHGASLIEFDVQVTKDDVPVVYHDFLVVEKGMDAVMHHITYDQFMAISQAQSNSGPVARMNSVPTAQRRRRSTGDPDEKGQIQGIISQMKHTLNFSGFKANMRSSSIHDPFIKLEELFRGMPESVAFDMEIKYPMLFEAGDFKMDTYAMELNHFLDTILSVVFKHAGPKRKIIISTFSPEVCMLLAVKQQIYPIVFLNDSSNWPTGDPRALSTQTAVHFARQFGLAGVAMAAEPFVASPGLIRFIKDRGLFTMSYGNLNDDVEAAKVQANAGLDVIIVNNVRKIKLALG